MPFNITKFLLISLIIVLFPGCQDATPPIPAGVVLPAGEPSFDPPPTVPPGTPPGVQVTTPMTLSPGG